MVASRLHHRLNISSSPVAADRADATAAHTVHQAGVVLVEFFLDLLPSYQVLLIPLLWVMAEVVDRLVFVEAEEATPSSAQSLQLLGVVVAAHIQPVPALVALVAPVVVRQVVAHLVVLERQDRVKRVELRQQTWADLLVVVVRALSAEVTLEIMLATLVALEFRRRSLDHQLITGAAVAVARAQQDITAARAGMVVVDMAAAIVRAAKEPPDR